MSTRAFQAEMWLKSHGSDSSMHIHAGQLAISNAPKHLPPLPQEIESDVFSPKNFFTPGWSGDSLNSKDIQKLSRHIEVLHHDAKQSFFTHHNFNRALKNKIYLNFIEYLDFKAGHETLISDYHQFWQELFNPHSEFRGELDDFINIFTYRATIIYVMKLRFIKVLQNQISTEFDIKHALYPNSFLTSVFKQGSSLELKSRALETSVYSWYRPQQKLQGTLLLICQLIDTSNIGELMRIISGRHYKLLRRKQKFSHALSHKNFGLFLNQLLLDFPDWLQAKKADSPFSYAPRDKSMETVSCLYTGDGLDSLCLSHWLAQKESENVKWHKIICPDFKGHEYDSGEFLRIVNEAHFLTMLVGLAKKQTRPVLPFICETVNGHLQNKKSIQGPQTSLLLNDNQFNSSTYNRLILNLHDYPKSNAQHYLIHQIQEKIDELKDKGLLFVLSTKKLFVPSQKSKVEVLLKRLNLQAIFDLEELKGKGEVGNYIYIFNKIKEKQNKKSDYKEKCYSFRITGELESFTEISKITHLCEEFFGRHAIDGAPMYRMETKDGFRLEYFQDAIMNGRLISASSKDSNSITHPSFFKNLMNSYLPFDYFFEIKNHESFAEKGQSYHSLFNLIDQDDQVPFPLAAIVDMRSPQTKIELIETSILDSKIYHYGQTRCHYFHLRCKIPGIHADGLQDFFNTSIGKQIIELTFNGELRKIKSKLSKLMIPKFLTDQSAIPAHLLQGLQILELTQDMVMQTHPDELVQQYELTEQFIRKIGNDYPAETLRQLSLFKRTMNECFTFFRSISGRESLNFSNPLLKGPLSKVATYPLYPNNQDVYIEFKDDQIKNFQGPLTKTKISYNESGLHSTHRLEFYSDNKLILELYSDKEMISFIDFIVSHFEGTPIQQILQGLHVPRIQDIKKIVKSFNQMSDAIQYIHTKIDPLIGQVVNAAIMQGNH